MKQFKTILKTIDLSLPIFIELIEEVHEIQIDYDFNLKSYLKNDYEIDHYHESNILSFKYKNDLYRYHYMLDIAKQALFINIEFVYISQEFNYQDGIKFILTLYQYGYLKEDLLSYQPNGISKPFDYTLDYDLPVLYLPYSFAYLRQRYEKYLGLFYLVYETSKLEVYPTLMVFYPTHTSKAYSIDDAIEDQIANYLNHLEYPDFDELDLLLANSKKDNNIEDHEIIELKKQKDLLIEKAHQKKLEKQRLKQILDNL